mmetsp:Transcript_26092/g.30091  ORF Transcript_26092/g.30091 Transcript_26092/m.30091 type:complete len:123 (-) Transcript_26092:2756-3124(-)
MLHLSESPLDNDFAKTFILSCLGSPASVLATKSLHASLLCIHRSLSPAIHELKCSSSNLFSCSVRWNMTVVRTTSSGDSSPNEYMNFLRRQPLFHSEMNQNHTSQHHHRINQILNHLQCQTS